MVKENSYRINKKLLREKQNVICPEGLMLKYTNAIDQIIPDHFLWLYTIL